MQIHAPIKDFILIARRALFALLCLFAWAGHSYGQVDCGLNSLDWANAYRMQGNYVPGAPLNPTSTAVKTIKVTVHVWRHDDGDLAVIPNLSFSNTPAGQQELANLVEQYVMPWFADIEAPNYPVPGFTYPDTDAKIRFDVVDVRFIPNTAAYLASTNPGSGAMLTALGIAEDPDSEGTLHVHIVRPGAPNPFAGPPPFVVDLGTFDGDVWAAIGPTYDSIYLVEGALLQWGDELAHELAHTLGLRHLYNSGLTEPCMFTDFEFLFDVFGFSNPPWALPPLPGCDVGMQACDQGNPPPGGCHNNILAQELPWADNTSITSLQIGRMHRNLMVANIAKYAWGYDPVPYTVAQSEIWDFPIKFYQDVIVPAGITLTVKCEVHMVPQARIVVQPGGKLIIDGGRIQAALFADARWRGIQVLGNANLAQTNANQGVVELRNGAEVADAIIGIRVGGNVSSQGGGIVRSIGSSVLPCRITNCGIGVQFSQYLQATSGSPYTYLANTSIFMSTRFEVNDNFMEYAVGAPFTNHARINRVYGLLFRSCTFINTRQPETSGELGHGIRAQDAHFFVRNSTFEGMDHGIHSTGTQPHAWFQAESSVFKNNICGAYVSGQLGCRIIGNRFIMGLRDVALTGNEDMQMFPFHRGVFTHETFKFSIQRNVLQRDADPLATQPTEGIVIGYDRDWNDVVRSNRAINLNRGFVGEGVNCSTTGYSSVVGLQFKCNENQNTQINIWSRPDGSVLPIQQLTHSIRTLQGDLSSVADNKLDNWPFGNAPTDDFRVTNTNMPVKYLHRTAAPYAPTDYGLPNAALLWLVSPAPTNTCPVIGEPPFGMAPQDPQVSEVELENEKLAYGNLRYQYDQLIDGGHTDEVVEEIVDAWPQDYLDLRAYLLAKSPYLSVKVLMQAMGKVGFPDAIRTEICIANPEATQKDGFIKWLQYECSQPLPEYLIGSIVASWNVKTYRSTLEAQMAHHHERYSQAAVEWGDHFLADTTQVPLDSLLRIWQEVRTPGARYAEANIYLEMGQYAAAIAVMNGLPLEHELKSPELLEKQRMLAWIGFVQGVRQSNRTLEADLTTAEIAQLEALIMDAQDRPAIWISNLLCFHYEHCQAVHTGEGSSEPKSLPYTPPAIAKGEAGSTLQLVPNPATTWISITYDMVGGSENGSVQVRDIMGRPVHQARISGTKGQLIWDCRGVPAGTYTVCLFSSSGAQLAVQRAIIKP